MQAYAPGRVSRTLLRKHMRAGLEVVVRAFPAEDRPRVSAAGPQQTY
jgi:hypothetical protein